MRGRKGEPGTHCSRMRPIFQDFLEIVFSPYISVDGDAMKSRLGKFCLHTGSIAEIRTSVVSTSSNESMYIMIITSGASFVYTSNASP